MAAGAIVPVAVNVAVPAGSRLTARVMLPVPPPPLQLDPAEAAHDQVTPVKAAGNVSVTSAPFTVKVALLLRATIVYVAGCPGTAAVWPSVLVMERSASRAVRP